MLSVLCKCENSCKGKDSAEYPSDLDITLRMRLPWAERQREMKIEEESSGWLLQRCNFLTDEDIESISELSSPSTSSLARLPPTFLDPLCSLRHGIGLTPKENGSKRQTASFLSHHRRSWLRVRLNSYARSALRPHSILFHFRF